MNKLIELETIRSGDGTIVKFIGRIAPEIEERMRDDLWGFLKEESLTVPTLYLRVRREIQEEVAQQVAELEKDGIEFTWTSEIQ